MSLVSIDSFDPAKFNNLVDIPADENCCCSDIWRKICEFFCWMFCVPIAENPAIESFYARDTQFTVLNGEGWIPAPTRVACTVIATEAAVQYLHGQLATREDAENALIGGGLRMLETLRLADIAEDVHRQVRDAGSGVGKQFLQTTFTEAVGRNPKVAGRRVQARISRANYLSADDPAMVRAFHGQLKQDFTQEKLLTRMTYYTVEGTQRERYAAALSYFAEFHAGKQKAAGVVTAGGSSYMIGLSLNDDGCVTEATLFDSHGHFSLAWHTGAVLKTWKTENPLADLAAYLTRLTSPQFQITPVEIALSNGSDQEGL